MLASESPHWCFLLATLHVRKLPNFSNSVLCLSCVCVCRARNPRFYFIHTGTKSRFLTKKGHRKSVIPCSVCMCGFCTHLANLVQKKSIYRSQRIAIISCVCVCRPRNPRFPIYRLCLQTSFRTRMRIFQSGISGSVCVCVVFVHILQTLYKRKAFHR